MIIKELFAKLGLDIDDFGFKKADTLLDKVEKGLMAIGAVAAVTSAALAGMVTHTMHTADEVDKLSQSLGISSQNLQELTYAASLSSIDLNLLNDGLRQMTGNMKSAAGGSEEFVEAFAKTGVKLTDASGKLRNTDEVFMDLADSISKMPDGAEKTALVLKVFGEEAFRFTPLLNQGRAGIQKLREEAHAMGTVMSADAIASAVLLGDELTRFKAVLSGLNNSITLAIIPSLIDLVRGMTAWIRVNRQFMSQRIDRVLAILRMVVRALLFVFERMWALLGFVVDNWRLWAVIIMSALVPAMIATKAHILGVMVAQAALMRAAIANAARMAAAWVAAHWPWILLAAIIGAVILLIDDVITALNGGDSVLAEWLGDDWVKTLKGWRDAFAEFWKWVTTGAARTWEAIKRGFLRVFGLDDGTEGGAKGYEDDKGRSPGEWRRDPNSGDLRFFPYSEGEVVPDDAMHGYKEEYGKGTWQRINNGELRFFPDDPLAYYAERFGSGSAGDGGVSGYQIGKPQKFSVVQNIQAAPGQSPGEVANEGVNQFDSWFARQLSDADAAIDGGGR